MIAAAAIIATTELVIDISRAPSPGTRTRGRSTTLWIRNWCIGSMAAIGSNVLSIVVVIQGRRLGRGPRFQRRPAHADRGADSQKDRQARAQRNAHRHA